MSSPHAGSKTIVELSRQDLRPGKLYELFRTGVRAALLKDDPRLGLLWQHFFASKTSLNGTPGSRPNSSHDLFKLARHHRSGESHYGQMARFVPGGFGHVARKMIVLQDRQSGKLRTLPVDAQDSGQFPLSSKDDLATAYELASEIMTSASPSGQGLTDSGVTIEYLEYPASAEEYHKICSLLADSGGRWAKLGHRLDAVKQEATGPFDVKFIRDAFAAISLMPGLGSGLRSLNALLRPMTVKSTPGDFEMLGSPHVDGSKWITVFSSHRETITTEVHDGRRWVELPLTTDSLVILPSGKARRYGLEPTLHRVLIRKKSPRPSRGNFTLIFAIIDLPSAGSGPNS